MNDTEKRAYKWLSEQLGSEPITFRHSTSPDFMTAGGVGYEIKKFIGYKIQLASTQWQNLLLVEDCYIVIFNDNPEPLAIIPIKGKVPPFQYGHFTINVLPDPLASYKRHLDILAQVSGRGLNGKEFWAEYRRIKEESNNGL